jgi:hypothetical protein
MNNRTEIKKICYVCGLELDEYPYSDPGEIPRANDSIICPCCGIHYGYDDEGAGDIIPDELSYSNWKFGDEKHIKIIKFWRDRWISTGMKWKHQDLSSLTFMPHNWDPEEQMKKVPREFR